MAELTKELEAAQAAAADVTELQLQLDAAKTANKQLTTALEAAKLQAELLQKELDKLQPAAAEEEAAA